MAGISRRAVSFVALASLFATFALLIGTPTLGASATVNQALAWLRTQQEADGGFEVANFPGFETSDATFAIASAAQPGGSWDADAALAAVAATRFGGSGNSPLEAFDDLADTPITKGQAAKAIVLVTNPLGIDATSFDPKCDGGTTNLVTVLGAPGVDGRFGFSLFAFNSILTAGRAYALTAGTGDVPDATITQIDASQKSDGSWSFDGDATGSGGDIDTTATAILTLLEDDDITTSDAYVELGLDYLESAQQGTGAWQSFGADDPNSTALALLALGVAGRLTFLPAGDAFLAAQQQPDGRFASPNDGFGINTFATSQAIQGLVRVEVPRATSVSPLTCTDADGVTDAVEWGAPNGGDGNDDGSPDAEQANVASLPGASGGYLTLEVPSGGSLGSVTASAAPGSPAPPTGATFPRGLVTFLVLGVTPGGTVQVELTLHGGPALTRYFKLHDGAWQDFTDHAAFAGNVITLTLTDHGPGDDDDTTNGVILDPSGPAVVSPAAAPGVPTAVIADPRLTG
ncbi:MAG: choice-of-anchor U domain-containing protein [Acidimicrobiia bacterium]